VGGVAQAAKVLLEAGADKNKRNALGWTPLHEAAFFNHVSHYLPLPYLMN
jgi:ankyrin repeat protein